MHRTEGPRHSALAHPKTWGLAGLLLMAAIGLTQCRMVDDRITGVDLRTAGRLSAGSECVRACNEAYKECKRAEDEIHRANLAACQGLGDVSARKACKKAELDRHQEAHQLCVARMRTCKDRCYDEGAGSFGS